jgi:phospholipase/carboxylesterase
MSSDRRTVPVSEIASGSAALAEARFIPQRYEPNYAYPLLVLFHGRGSDEHHLVSAMPALSWRNYIGLSLRAPEPIVRRGELIGYSWGPIFARPDRMGEFRQVPEAPGQAFRRLLTSSSVHTHERVEDATFNAIRDLRRTLHVHSERIFLLGVGEGAAAAFRLALGYPERFAGVVAINGWLPPQAPLARVKDCRSLRILVVHGEWNGRAPVDLARKNVGVLKAGGLNVAFQAYPCGHRLTSPMLADVDTWLMHQCTQPVA